MAEPRVANGNARAQRTRTYAGTMSQYNRILARFNEMAENGEYDDTARRREGLVDRLMYRYTDNIVNSPAYLRTYAENSGKSREEAYRAADAVPVPYSVYARRRRNNR